MGIEIQYEIIPRVGLGKIRFGVPRPEVKDLLGAPNSIEGLDEAPTDWETWKYTRYMTHFSFDQSYEFRLISLQSTSPELTLFGLSGLIGTTHDALLEMLPGEMGPKERDIYGGQLGWQLDYLDLNLQFVFGQPPGTEFGKSVLEIVSWSVAFDKEGDCPIWPA